MTAADGVDDLDAVCRYFSLERMTLLEHSREALLAGLYATEDPLARARS